MTTNPTEERVSRLEGAYEQVDRRLGSIDERLAAMDARIETRFSSIEARFSSIEARMNAMMAIMVTGFIAIGGGIVASPCESEPGHCRLLSFRSRNACNDIDTPTPRPYIPLSVEGGGRERRRPAPQRRLRGPRPPSAEATQPLGRWT